MKQFKIAFGAASAGVLLAGCSSLTPMNEASLARLMEGQADAQNGTSVTIADAVCRATSRTKANGDGWYMCSFRRQGESTSYIYPVEVGNDSWNTAGSNLTGNVSSLTQAQIEHTFTSMTGIGDGP